MTTKAEPTVTTVAYIRVSTARQASSGYGLEAQLAAVEPVDHVFSDTIRGATPPAGRPAFRQLLSYVKANRGTKVIFPRLDRLTRDLIAQETALAALWASDAEVHSADHGKLDPDDPGQPTRRLIRLILGAVAEYDRASITARMLAGRAIKRAQGGYAGDGAPPYGWRSNGAELEKVPAEQDTLAAMFQWKAGGASLREIARRLDAAGQAPRRGARWSPSTISRILERST